MSYSFNLLIFDWDGTLMDSQARIIDSFQTTIAELGLQPRTAHEIRQIVGLGLFEGFRSLCQDANDAQLKQAMNIYRAHYFSAQAKPSPLFPNATRVLNSLSDAGYKLAIATGKGRRGLDEALQRTKLSHLFQVSRCAEETISKPDPQMLYEILHELNIEAQHAVLIGDSVFDLEMASNAGMSSIAVSYGLQEKPKLLDYNPITCIDDLTELPIWLNIYNSIPVAFDEG